MKFETKKAFYDARQEVVERNAARREAVEMHEIERLMREPSGNGNLLRPEDATTSEDMRQFANYYKFADENIVLKGVRFTQIQGQANFIAGALMKVAPKVLKAAPLDSFIKVTFMAYDEENGVTYDVYVAGVVVAESTARAPKVIQIVSSNIKVLKMA